MSGTATLRTLQVGKGWFPEQSGGLNRYYHELLRHLPASGVEVAGLVAGSDRVSDQSGGVVRPFAPSRASLPTRLSRVRHLAKHALGEHPASLFVTHFALYAAPCLDLLGDRPVVVHFHGPWSAESRTEGASALAAGLKYWVEDAVYRRGARFIVLSHAFAGLLAERHAVPTDRIRVIPGGVDTTRFAPGMSPAEARARLGWPTDRPIALVVRRLVKRMGLEDLISAVELARAAVPDLLLVIAGTGPLAEELEQRAAAGAARNIRFAGFLPDDLLPLAFRAADLSVVPSVALEGFGLIVLESLAAGTPVLVTRVGGLPETVAGLSEACVVREPGPLGLAVALTDAVRGRQPLPPAEDCLRHVRQRFDWQVIAARVGAVYAEVL